jgi:hypothetical protein
MCLPFKSFIWKNILWCIKNNLCDILIFDWTVSDGHHLISTKKTSLWTATRRHKIHGRVLHSYRVLHRSFNLLIKMFSVSGVPIILPFFRSPTLTLWLIVPRGCNRERRLSVKLFWFSQYYYNFNRIKILKRNPKKVICKNVFTICLSVTLKINLEQKWYGYQIWTW